MTHKILFGTVVSLIRMRMRWRILLIALWSYRNPITAFKAVLYLLRLRRNVKGKQVIKKLVRHDQEYYFGAYVPPYKSPLFKHFVLNKLKGFKATDKPTRQFNTVFFAITKKCPLQCEHCFEWDVLNRKEVLDLQKINSILMEMDHFGYNQLILSGGEPMVRLDWLLDILADWGKRKNCWVFTSGYDLSLEHCRELKNGGLKGFFISLDHHDKTFHNAFRGNDHAYNWVIDGINNAKATGLLVCLTLCVTASMAREKELSHYMDLARDLGVEFVQFLEPKSVGHYAGKDVELHQDQIALIEHFFQRFNTDPHYKDYPIIMYHGYHQRRIGCFNAGQYGLYINTDGRINACPFCHNAVRGDKASISDQLETISAKGCVEYGTVKL